MERESLLTVQMCQTNPKEGSAKEIKSDVPDDPWLHGLTKYERVVVEVARAKDLQRGNPARVDVFVGDTVWDIAHREMMDGLLGDYRVVGSP